MRIAIVHDWLTVYAGAEKVLHNILTLYPEADVFTLVDFLPERDRGFLKGKNVYTSFIQNMPFAKKKYRHYLPLMPLAIEQFDLSKYNLVISSSHAVAKGVITGPDQVHICYCHSPIRYAWDMQHQYLKQSGLDRGLKGFLSRLLLHYIRLWDVRTASGVDQFIANSQFIARRIKKVYGRDAIVVYPPVDIERFRVTTQKEDFYLAASRMVSYKRLDLIVDAFRYLPDKKLVVIGDGPEFKRIAAKAGPNVKLLGYQPDNVLQHYMERAKAFIFAAEEDFGIMPVEAQACGTPVLAYGKGGATETILPGITGLFFQEQTTDSIISVIKEYDKIGPFNPYECRRNAERFSVDNFRANFARVVDAALATTKHVNTRNESIRNIGVMVCSDDC